MERGDEQAQAEIYEEFVPYLRIVARRYINQSLRSKFDSVDVVQSVWTDLIVGLRNGKWTFSSAKHLRAFLAQATRNRVIDYVRKHQRTADHEPILGAEPKARTPHPSAEARAREHFEEILSRCSEGQRPIVELKCQGFSLAEIADRTGYHTSSIRRILYSLNIRDEY